MYTTVISNKKLEIYSVIPTLVSDCIHTSTKFRQGGRKREGGSEGCNILL